MAPKVAIVLVCWNNADLLPACLGSIAAQTHPASSVILVDNGSADGSVSVATGLMPGIAVIEAGYNSGFARANNIGIARALEDSAVKYVALVNTDATLDPDWLRALVSFAQGNAELAFLQGLTLDHFDHDVIDSTHLFLDHSGYGSQGRWKERLDGPLPSSKVFGVNAAACVVTRDFIEAQPFGDFFDESLFMYLEDVDVAARATIMGWSSYFVPDAIAYHMGSASSSAASRVSRLAFYMTFRNDLGVLVKNLPLGVLLRILPRAPIADFRTIRRLLRCGEWRVAGEVVRGRLVSLGRLPLYLRKRAVVRKVARADPASLWSLMEKGY